MSRHLWWGCYFPTQPHPHSGPWICPQELGWVAKPYSIWGVIIWVQAIHGRKYEAFLGLSRGLARCACCPLQGVCRCPWGSGPMRTGRTQLATHYLQVWLGFHAVACAASQVVLSTPSFFFPPWPIALLPPCSWPYALSNLHSSFPPLLGHMFPALLRPSFWNCKSIILGWETLAYFSLPSQHNTSSFLRVSLRNEGKFTSR